MSLRYNYRSCRTTSTPTSRAPWAASREPLSSLDSAVKPRNVDNKRTVTLRQRLIISPLFMLIVSQNLFSQEISSIPSYQKPHIDMMLMHDPTEPYNYIPGSRKNLKETGPLQLQSTIIGKTRKIALINNTFVQIGDTIGTSKVIAISDGRVVLVDSGRTVTLILFKNDIRK
jgi:hypothetical protein